jgi:hypothetical protein
MRKRHNHRGCIPGMSAAILVAFLIVASGCNSKPTSAREKPEKSSPASTASAAQGPDLQCVADRIRNAPGPFHFSYIKDGAILGHSDWEADVTPDAIDGSLTNSTGTHKIQAIRAQGHDWDMAAAELAMGLPASTFVLFNHNSAIAAAGAETVNGYSATKYTVDTSRTTGAQASLIRNILGANGSITGTVWAVSDGCIVKFTIDVQSSADGTLQKEHYEEAMLAKQ